MSFWSDFVVTNPKEWEQKVLKDFKTKVKEDFIFKTDYGNINPFSKNVNSLHISRNEILKEIRWKFSSQKNLNKAILNRLNNGVNSIYLSGIKFKKTIFKNVMCDIINNHIKLNPKWSGNDLQLWNNWGISIASGTLRMDPLEDMLENYDDHQLKVQLDSYLNFKKTLNNQNLNCIYVDCTSYESYFKNYGLEIAVTAAHLNEIIEFHKSNKIEIPPRFIISIAINNSYLESVSKIIAIRTLIHRISNAHQLNINIEIETVISPKILQNKEFDFRLMSITCICMASLLGGANSFELSDDLIQSNDEYWKKIIVNIPLILREESHLNNHMSEGAHVIEEMASKMAHKSWSLFKNIETQNGLLQLLKTNQFSNFIK